MLEEARILREAAAFRQRITPAKIAMDEALAEMGRLLTHTAMSSINAGLASAVAHPALVELKAAIAGGIDVRGSLIRVHGAAKDVGRTLIPELNWGPTEDTTPEGREIAPPPVMTQAA